MHKLIAPAILAFALAVPAAAETRNHSGFDGVAVQDRIRVEVSLGQSYSVDVSGSDAARVRTRVQDGTLRISDRNRPLFGGSPRLDAVVRVVVPELDRLAASRGAEVRATDISAHDFSVAASMGGEVRLTGACHSLSASASMGGIINAERFACADADVAASMGGEANVAASASYDAAASMGGLIDIRGEGARGEIATSMGGEVRRN